MFNIFYTAGGEKINLEKFGDIAHAPNVAQLNT